MKLTKQVLIFISAFLFLINISFADPEIGKKAPEFSAMDLAGNKVNLSDYVGKTVVLEWHNPNCPFVVKHYGSNNMQELQNKYTKKGVVWITVNSGAMGKSGAFDKVKMKMYLENSNANPTHYISDFSGSIGKLYEARTTPHMYVVNEEGVLVYKGAIDSNSSARAETIKGATNYVSQAIDELMAKKEVSISDTESYGCSVKY